MEESINEVMLSIYLPFFSIVHLSDVCMHPIVHLSDVCMHPRQFFISVVPADMEPKASAEPISIQWYKVSGTHPFAAPLIPEDAVIYAHCIVLN